MNRLFGDQVEPITEKAISYIRVLKVLMIFQLIVSILDIVATTKFLREGLFGLFLLFPYCNAIYKVSYKSLLICIFMALFFAIIFLVYICTIIQNSSVIPIVLDSWGRYYLATACISSVYYIIVAIFGFYPYKQFKSLEYLSNPAFTEMMMNPEINPTDQPIQPINAKNDDKKFNKNSEIKTDAEDKKSGFQAFKGQGVRIG